jgi:glycine/D-amino acid oxidase-like deaminating enzyme
VHVHVVGGTDAELKDPLDAATSYGSVDWDPAVPTAKQADELVHEMAKRSPELTPEGSWAGSAACTTPLVIATVIGVLPLAVP